MNKVKLFNNKKKKKNNNKKDYNKYKKNVVRKMVQKIMMILM